jgi:flagellar biogenesis protein FliO
MDWWAVIVALLMLVVFGGVAWGIRRFAGPVRIGGAQHIHIVGARRLDLNTTLYLVEVEGRRLLVGSGREGARLVADLTADPTSPPFAGG